MRNSQSSAITDPAFTGHAEANGCRMELRLAVSAAAWNAEIPGELRLIGDGNQQQIHRLEVVLTGDIESVGLGRESPLTLDSARWESLTVPANGELTQSFTLRMGWGMAFRAGARLRASAQFSPILGNLQIAATIGVLPLPEFLTVAQAAADAARLTLGPWLSLDGGDAATATFKVGEEMRDVFDGLRIKIYRGKGVVYGTLIIDPQEHSLHDRLRAALGLDLKTVEFRLPLGDAEAARAYFQEQLRPYVNAVRHLPIPARERETDQSSLPRPAHAQRER